MHYKMNGLRADNTQGWMAAVGVLYILDRMGSDVQMLWDNYHPVIHGLGKDQVIDTLKNYLHIGSGILDRLPDGVRNEKASLDLTAGRVNLREVIAQMLVKVDRVKINEALNEPWSNKDNITSLGWDAGAVKLSASVGGENAPDASPHRGVLAGQWLAAESLPITGTGPRKDLYRLVTWSVPLDIGGARAVIQAMSVDWGGACYAANVARNGKMGYLELARTISSQ
jgi:hypothetical protein